MDIYSIGFTKTTAEGFFTRLIDNRVQRVLDVRLNTKSQLAGFAKGRDLAYFLPAIAGIAYEHEPMLCPSAEILEQYKRRGEMPWGEYERQFMALMRERRVADRLDPATFEPRNPEFVLNAELRPLARFSYSAKTWELPLTDFTVSNEVR